MEEKERHEIPDCTLEALCALATEYRITRNATYKEFYDDVTLALTYYEFFRDE
jgi:hypothetical protein